MLIFGGNLIFWHDSQKKWKKAFYSTEVGPNAEKNNKQTVTVLSPLKVGSCPKDDHSVQILFCSFLCSIGIILCSESVAAEKMQDFA